MAQRASWLAQQFWWTTTALLHISEATEGASAISMGDNTTLAMENGTLITEGNFRKGIYSKGSNSTTTIKNGSHVDVNSIVRDAENEGPEAHRYRRHADL